MNATELPRIMYHVPPKVLSSAVFITFSLPSTKLSPQTPGMSLPMKNTSAMNRFSPSAANDMSEAARGP